MLSDSYLFRDMGQAERKLSVFVVHSMVQDFGAVCLAFSSLAFK